MPAETVANSNSSYTFVGCYPCRICGWVRTVDECEGDWMYYCEDCDEWGFAGSVEGKTFLPGHGDAGG